MSTEEQERGEEPSWDVVRTAVRRVQSVLIANASRLDTPFSNAAGSPWSAFVAPALHNLRRAVGLRDDSPRSWSLPEEPGPEVTRLKAKDGTEWERCGETRWDQRSTAGDPQECLTFVGVMVNHGEVSDATQERTP